MQTCITKDVVRKFAVSLIRFCEVLELSRYLIGIKDTEIISPADS